MNNQMLQSAKLIGAGVATTGASPSDWFGLAGVVALLLGVVDVLVGVAGMGEDLSTGLDSDALSGVAGTADGVAVASDVSLTGSSKTASLLLTSAASSIGIPIPIKVPTGMDSLKSLSSESKKPQEIDKQLTINSKKLINKR